MFIDVTYPTSLRTSGRQSSVTAAWHRNINDLLPRAEEDFTEILDHYRIEAFLDVRSFPTSKNPIFKKGYLEDLIKANGMEYHYLGEELGGFRKGGYEKYTETDSFHKGVDRVEEIARKKRSVIVCAERFPWKCHRRWIARELHAHGWHVIHIIDLDKVWEPE